MVGRLIHWKTDKNSPTGRMCMFLHFEASQSKKVVESLCWDIVREMSVALLRLQFDSRAVDRSAVVLNESLRERFFFRQCEIIWPSGKTRRWQLDSVSRLLTFKMIAAATLIFPSQYVYSRHLYLRLHPFFDFHKTITQTLSHQFLSLLASKSLSMR